MVSHMVRTRMHRMMIKVKVSRQLSQEVLIKEIMYLGFLGMRINLTERSLLYVSIVIVPGTSDLIARVKTYLFKEMGLPV